MTQSAILTVENIDKTFRVGFWRERVEAVRDVSFEVREGEIFGIVGPNGAGKTTTMKVMTHLIFPDAGEVQLFGKPTSHTESRRRLGYLPEEPYFYGHLSATEMLQYYGALHGMSRRTIDDRVDDLLELVGLADVPNQPLREFSKGMRQRAGIAQALVNDPDLVILDEPQSGLDPVGRKEVRDLIFRLRDQGKTVVFSSHILVDVEAVCDRVGVMDEGEMVEITDMTEQDDRESSSLEVAFSGLPREAVSEMAGVERLERSGNKLLAEMATPEDFRQLVSTIVERDGTILDVNRRGRGLEQRFLAETQEDSP